MGGKPTERPNDWGSKDILSQLNSTQDRTNNIAQQAFDFQKQILTNAQTQSADSQAQEGVQRALNSLGLSNEQQQATDYYKSLQSKQTSANQGNQAIGGSFDMNKLNQGKTNNMQGATGSIPNTTANNPYLQPNQANNPITNKVGNQQNQPNQQNRQFPMPQNMPKFGGY